MQSSGSKIISSEKRCHHTVSQLQQPQPQPPQVVSTLELDRRRQTVAMELAAALHHSCGVRGQETASSGGVRPAPLSEVAGPQCAATTLGYVAAVEPLLTTPPLGAVGVARTSCCCTPGVEGGGREEWRRTEQVAGGRKLLEEWIRGGKGRRRGRERCLNLPVVPPHLAPSASGNLDILLNEPFVSGSPVLCLGVASTADTCTCVGTGGILIMSWFLRTGGPRIRGRFSRQSGHYAEPLAGSSLFGV